MSHALTAYFGMLHSDTAPFAGHTTVADFLVFTAIAFIVLDGTENPLAKQAVFFGLKRPVVYCLRLSNFTV